MKSLYGNYPEYQIPNLKSKPCFTAFITIIFTLGESEVPVTWRNVEVKLKN